MRKLILHMRISIDGSPMRRPYGSFGPELEVDEHGLIPERSA